MAPPRTATPDPVRVIEVPWADLRAGLGGEYRAPVIVGQTVQLLRLPPCDEEFARAPMPVLVSVGYDFLGATAQTWTGRLDVVGEIRFAAGASSHSFQFDIPAGGTVVSVVSPDGLELRATVEGTSPDGQIGLRCGLALVKQSHPRPVYRTLEWTMPGDNGVIQQIPRYARRFQLMGSDPLLLPLCTVDLLSSPVLAAGVRHVQLTPTEGTYYAIPIASESMRVISGGGNHTVRVPYELQP